ncbi:helix-turn-helix domain-containing protein [Enterobacter cloacae]|nr:helix-turn-helix domain-containing protein [Enterobacter cloacae]
MALMSEPVVSLQDDTRKQLGAFLRARRESLDPQRLGLPRSGRRRTPGLRREEVAMLADVGVTWYTWLEQGRDVNPSSAVMAAVAKALQCTPTEARHLFLLAGYRRAKRRRRSAARASARAHAACSTPCCRNPPASRSPISTSWRGTTASGT